MACPHVESTALQAPTPAQSVYREDCTQCFDSIDDPSGLNVCLHCFNGGCAGDRHHDRLHNALWGHPLVVNIKRTRKHKIRDEPPLKMSKLAIAAETEADRYDTATVVRCLECDKDLGAAANQKLVAVVEGIMKANTFSRQEEIKAWEQEYTSCEHILTLQQHESRAIPSGDLGHCSGCDLKENLWLCLECGNLGCGRKQLGGVDGNSHALAHANSSGHGVAVKLGSITPEGTADVYCYRCDEERIDNDLAEHLAHWGVNIAERQKTERSLTEMQVEQNLKWDFSLTTEDGKELTPLFGPGQTGLRNLGNSCYLASVLQCLFDVPSFQNRYYKSVDELPVVQEPAADLETQLRKMADGLCSGRYSVVDPDIASDVPQQKGIAPAMLKHLIGRGHEEFSTMRQQDAFELLQHLFKLISRSKHVAPLQDPTQPFRFALEQRLQCLSCKRVSYKTTEEDSIFMDVPIEKLPVPEGAESVAPAYKPVTLKECLDKFTGEVLVELTCSACGSKDGFSKRTLFKTFPQELVVNVQKMDRVNWVPIKIDVPVLVPEEPFLLDDYLSSGLQPSEEELPQEAETSSAPKFEPNAVALEQLEGMGFPRNRCERALHATGNSDANAAMEWIFAHMDDSDIDAPLVLSGQGGGAPADPEKVAMLESMGFGAPQARKALRETGGDVERAVEWLFSHPDEQGEFDDDKPASSEAPVAKDPPGSAALPAKFALQSLVCHKGTSIHAGHYVAFIRRILDNGHAAWVLFNDEKVVKAEDVDEMRKFAYVYFFKRL